LGIISEILKIEDYLFRFIIWGDKYHESTKYGDLKMYLYHHFLKGTFKIRNVICTKIKFMRFFLFDLHVYGEY